MGFRSGVNQPAVGPADGAYDVVRVKTDELEQLLPRPVPIDLALVDLLLVQLEGERVGRVVPQDV